MNNNKNHKLSKNILKKYNAHNRGECQRATDHLKQHIIIFFRWLVARWHSPLLYE